MEPTEGLIPTPTAVTVCRDTARTGEKSIHSRSNINHDNERRWAPIRFVM
jgi:hypothetical protein